MICLSWQATISEVQRLSRVGPTTLLHRTEARTSAGGFLFEKDSWFLVNLSAIMMDPLNFPHPLVFNPARFIGPDNRYKRRVIHVIAIFISTCPGMRRMRGWSLLVLGRGCAWGSCWQGTRCSWLQSIFFRGWSFCLLLTTPCLTLLTTQQTLQTSRITFMSDL